MNQQYFIGTTNFNNNNSVKLIDSNKSSLLSNDDLLSTHPLLTENDYNKNNNNNTESNVLTSIEKKIIVISTQDRDFITETLFDFKITFNGPSKKFIKMPVYFNNRTIPQNSFEREQGYIGKENLTGWTDTYGNIYPSYNPKNEKGEIITYDSILDNNIDKINVALNINNIISIKLESAYIPNRMFSNHVFSSPISRHVNYLNVNITPLDINYSSSNKIINSSTDVLVNIPSSNQACLYKPLSNYSLKFNPPRNGLNVFNVSIRPDGSPYIQSEKEKEKFNRLLLNDSVVLNSIEFYNYVIKLNTTFFNCRCWKAGMIIQLKNLAKKIYDNLDTISESIESKSANFPLLKKKLEEAIKEVEIANNNVIELKIILDLAITKEEKEIAQMNLTNASLLLNKALKDKQKIENEIEILPNTLLKIYDFLTYSFSYFNDNTLPILFCGFETEKNEIYESPEIGNFILIPQFLRIQKIYSLPTESPLEGEISQKLNDLNTVFPENILKIINSRLIHYIHLFEENRLSILISTYIKKINLNNNNKTENNIKREDVIVINVSMQSLYIFEISYLAPKLEL